ncbi:MAG: GTP-binding protein [Burkholderiaceae bacterium]
MTLGGDTIPVVLIGGFLGSGKSTLLGALLRAPGMADTAVIVNEFGEVGIDHALLERGDADDAVVLLESGCICCTLTSSLEDTLETLYYRRERGEIPFFSRVAVETTGLADPGPIAASIAGGLFIGRRYRVAGIVITADALAGADTLTRHDEARRQIAMADRIVLTKIDADDDGQGVTRLRTAIARLNPTADVRAAVFGAIDPDWVIDGPSASVRLPGGGRRREQENEHDHARDHVHGNEHDRGHEHDRDHDHAHDHLDAHGYGSAIAYRHRPLGWAAYAAWVARLQHEAGPHLLRAKGIVRFDDGKVRAIQGVRLLFSPPAEMARPLIEHAAGAIVLIAQGLDREHLQRLADAIDDDPRDTDQA